MNISDEDYCEAVSMLYHFIWNPNNDERKAVLYHVRQRRFQKLFEQLRLTTYYGENPEVGKNPVPLQTGML